MTFKNSKILNLTFKNSKITYCNIISKNTLTHMRIVLPHTTMVLTKEGSNTFGHGHLRQSDLHFMNEQGDNSWDVIRNNTIYS